MEIIFRIILGLVGIVNFIPSLAAFLPAKIKTGYGIEIPDVNYELLLRHRAMMLGIIGGLMIYAALTKKNYDLATLLGLISMVSFVAFFFMGNGVINAEISKVMKIDAVAIVFLVIGYLFYKFK